MKRSLVILAGLMLVMLVTAVPVNASPLAEFYAEKVFPSSGHPMDNVCDILACPQFPQLVGGEIWYFDRATPGGKEIARVEVRASDGSGMLIGQVRWLGEYGLFTFGRGTGSLAGVHVNGRVDVLNSTDVSTTFALTGTYHIEPR